MESLEVRRGRRYVKRWPDLEVGEPAHGFMMRVALAHHEPSAAVFAKKLDLYDSDDAEGCLLALSGSLLAERRKPDLEMLRRWTPLFTGSTGVVNGETIRRDDWSNRFRKHCRACLAEKPFHRTWFDFTFVAVCPFHGTPVSDRMPDGTRAYFHTADMTMTAAGIKVATHAQRLSGVPETLEAYALGRLGLMPRRPLPFLDAVTLGEVVEASEVMGRLVERGWLKNSPEPVGIDTHAAPGTKAAGFAVLAEGPEGARSSSDPSPHRRPRRPSGSRRCSAGPVPTSRCAAASAGSCSG